MRFVLRQLSCARTARRRRHNQVNDGDWRSLSGLGCTLPILFGLARWWRVQVSCGGGLGGEGCGAVKFAETSVGATNLKGTITKRSRRA